jgi:hypothetical protein
MCCYLIPIIYVVWFSMGKEKTSVSCIVCKKPFILMSMVCMGFFTLWYEYLRENTFYSFSFVSMFSLLTAIMGILCTDETKRIHYVFASIAFLSIYTFMVVHLYESRSNRKDDDSSLFSFFFLSLLVVLETLLFPFFFLFDGFFFFLSEVLFLVLFATCFLYLHFK